MALLVLLSACGNRAEDEVELRGFLKASERVPRGFSYTEAAKDRWYALTGRVSDDLRYGFTLSSPRGPLLDVVVSDDALAVRLPRPALLAPLAPFVHPATWEALQSGRWVVDPAGAPPIGVPAKTGAAAREAPDPLETAARLFRTVRLEMSQARQVREFNPEDIEYKPSEDPWEYPVLAAGEKRYDLLRSPLPKREEQLQQGQGQIGEPQFRKVSVFERGGRIERVCESVDVEGHEEFVRLRERGIRNPFLESIRRQVLEGRTEAPVRPRMVYIDVSYPASVKVALPKGLQARLDVFLSVLRIGFKQGLLAPPGPAPSECLRSETVGTGAP